MKEKLAEHLRDRPEQLRQLKSNGVKIVSYFASNYVPEEIIYAAGAVPICLADARNLHAADVALSVVPRMLCPFARTQIGEMLLKENPYYTMLDMLVAPVTCQHLRKTADIWEYYGNTDIFRLGVPHEYYGDFELEYYAGRLRALRERLQILTGNEVTDEKISQAIDLYNKMRELLRKISLMRKVPQPQISALDFIRLNHASFYADPVFMVDTLDSIYQELSQKQQASDSGRPRLLLIGPNMGYGDYKILSLVEEVGGEIVTEELCEGIRYYWQNIENKGDLIQSLAKGYLWDRLPCAFLGASAKRRFDFVMKLIEEFNVAGVIWYELIYCETYDAESFYFTQKLHERGIPILVLESDYSITDVGPFKTRIEAFLEVVKGGME